MSAHSTPLSARNNALPPAAILWWGIGAFVFLCGLCLQQHLRPIFERKTTAEQAQRWRNAPGLTMSFTYGSARISGSIPSQAAHERLLARAREVLGTAEVVDALRLDEQAVPDDWLDSAVSLLWLAGKKIDNGKIELNGARILVSGTLTDAADKYTLIDNMQAVISEHASLNAQIAAAPAVVVDVFPTETNRAAAGFDDGAEAFEQRTLARSARADQADHLAGANHHVYTLQGVHRSGARAEALGQALHQDRFAGRSRLGRREGGHC